MNKFKESRGIGLLIISIIYILTIILQVLLFKIIDFNNIYFEILLVDIIATIFVFVFSLLFKNASIYDPYWSVEPIIIMLTLMLHNKLNNPIVISFAVALGLWGIRLTINWVTTFKNLNHQDWRYTMLKEKTKQFYPIVSFLGIHLFPTIVVFLCMIPMINFISINFKNYYSYFGIVLMLIGITFQVLADYDIYVYHKRNKDDRRQILNIGLWKYSRHPNYLGEILLWYGVFFTMLPVSFNNWYFVLGAIINILMFVFISIPMSEKRLKTYKFNYEQYQEDTRMLLPFKK